MRLTPSLSLVARASRRLLPQRISRSAPRTRRFRVARALVSAKQCYSTHCHSRARSAMSCGNRTGRPRRTASTHSPPRRSPPPVASAGGPPASARRRWSAARCGAHRYRGRSGGWGRPADGDGIAQVVDRQRRNHRVEEATHLRRPGRVTEIAHSELHPITESHQSLLRPVKYRPRVVR